MNLSKEERLDGAALTFALFSCIAALGAAIFSMRTLWAERGSQIDVEKFASNALASTPDIYATEWSLLSDKLAVHIDDNKRLEEKWLQFSRGATLLVLAWIVAILQFVVSF